MTDSALSWAILTAGAFVSAVWFVIKIMREDDRRREEAEEYWRKVDGI